MSYSLSHKKYEKTYYNMIFKFSIVETNLPIHYSSAVVLQSKTALLLKVFSTIYLPILRFRENISLYVVLFVTCDLPKKSKKVLFIQMLNFSTNT